MKTQFNIDDKVRWNSEAGIVSGNIIKIHNSDFDFKSFTHHATLDNQQYVIKSNKVNLIAECID